MKKILVVYLCLIALGLCCSADETLQRQLQRFQHDPEAMYSPEPQGKITEAKAERSAQIWLPLRLFRLGAVQLVFDRTQPPVCSSSLLLKRTSSKVQKFRSVFGNFQPEDWGLCGSRLPRADG